MLSTSPFAVPRAAKLHRLADVGERLSPIWELYIRVVLQPRHRQFLQEALGRGPEKEKRTMHLRKNVLLHPFNLSDDRVNLMRAEAILTTFGNTIASRSSRESELQVWWPQNAAALVEAIKKEREEMDAYGCIARGGRELGKGEEGATAATITEAEDDAPPTKRQRVS